MACLVTIVASLKVNPLRVFHENHAFCIDDQIDGAAFTELTEGEVKAIVKPLGVVKKILRLQKSIVQSVSLLFSL